jgi:hypothetical protein
MFFLMDAQRARAHRGREHEPDPVLDSAAERKREKGEEKEEKKGTKRGRSS